MEHENLLIALKTYADESIKQAKSNLNLTGFAGKKRKTNNTKSLSNGLGYDIKEDNDNEDLMVRMSDIRTYGMIVEWNGFAYNIDTVDFYKKNKKDILRLAEEMAESYDEDMFIMIKSFKCLGGDYTTAEIAKALYARNGDYSIQGAIVWAAVEEVANWFDAQIRG